MPALKVELPFPIFSDIDGNPLEDGYVYIGGANLNPESNPIQTYWDSSLSIPIAQPIRTVGGYASRNGAPGKIYVDAANFSITVRNKNKTLIWSELDGSGISPNSDGVSFLQAGSGAVDRSVQTKLRESISVKDFGAVGDGIADDSTAILAADTYASSIGKDVFFPSGVYAAKNLEVTTNWHGEKGSTIINNGAATLYTFASVTTQTDITIKNLIFDGNVSADPASWNSGNYNTFTGAIALYVYNSSNVLLENCVLRNSVNGPLRIENSTLISVSNCQVRRGRGNFGDGIYIRNSSYCLVANTYVYDFTRIGIVTEGGSHSCTFSNNICEYGHDASILYGGGEYNAGFWYENSGNIITTGCRVKNCTHLGFVCTTGTVSLPTSTAFFIYSSCESVDCLTAGFQASSIAPTPTNVKFTGCEVYGSGKGFVTTASHEEDSFSHVNCHAEIDFNLGSMNTIAYMFGAGTLTNKAEFIYSDCTTQYKNLNLADLQSASSNSADISTFSGGTSRLLITNVRNLDAQYPITVKTRIGSVSPIIKNCHLDYRTGVISELLNISECLLNYVSVNGAGVVRIDKCRAIANSIGISTTAEIFISNSDFRLAGSQILQIIRTLDSKRPAVQISNCRFEKDIAVNDYILRLQEDGTNKPNIIISDCVFYNTGAATAVNVFIWVVRSGTLMNYFDNLSDNNVTYLVRTNTTLGNPGVGDTKVAMH